MTASPGRALLLNAISEAEFQNQVIAWAKDRGWLVTSMHDSRKLWWGVDPGFPDLLLLRGGRVVAAEIKDMTGRLRKDQVVWRDALLGSPVEWFLWRPNMEDEIKQVLE